MASLDHWHPVCSSRSLRLQPKRVCVDGTYIVLFRTGKDGRIGALDDQCLHRRMSLSQGSVVDGCLICPYHGWSYDSRGAGESPGTPKMRVQGNFYETLERHGVVWLHRSHSQCNFPEFPIAGMYHCCTLWHHVDAPLEVVVDNFCEIEHTPTTHGIFGYELQRMHQVSTHVETTDTTVRVINAGPAKPINWFIRLLMGIRDGDHFVDEWTTYFSPVYSVFDHSWTDAAGTRQSRVRFRNIVFYTPQDNQSTMITTFVFSKSTYPGPYGGVRLFKPMVRTLANREVWRDVDMLHKLADKSPDLEGMKLSRFDRALGPNRERIAQIYHGHRRNGMPDDETRLVNDSASVSDQSDSHE